MIPTPAILARLRRTPKPEPKPGPTPAPAPAACGQPGCDDPALHAHVIRVSPPPETRPRRTWVDAAISETEIHREAIVLDELAALTDRYGPREAAMKLFGGDR